MLYSLTVLLGLVSVTMGKVFQVEVGRNEAGEPANVFTPNQITAQKGDRVEFVFRGKNHTVTQSSFAEPCTQQFNTVTNLPGVDSGFMAVPATATEIPVYSIQVVDDGSPQWFFCNQGNHCNGGMVFAINAPTSGERSFDRWVELARSAAHPDPALRQTANFTPEGSGNAGAGAPNNENSGIPQNNEITQSAGNSGSPFTTSFAASPTLASGGTTSFEFTRTSPTVFVGSIPANAATAVPNVDAAAQSAAAIASAGFRLEPRGVLGMVLLGAMSLALGL